VRHLLWRYWIIGENLVMSKKLAAGILVIILVLSGVVWHAATNPDRIVQEIVENTASDILKTRVSLSDMSIDMKQGKVVIGGLNIVNPEGYSQEYIFEIKGIEVDFEFDSNQKNLLVIRSIWIDDPLISFEGKNPGDSNMQDLFEKAANFSTETSPTAKEDKLRIIIEKLEVNGGRIKASSIKKPSNIIKVKLPAFEITGIGRASGGVSTREAVSLVSGELFNAVIRATAKSGVYLRLKENNMEWLNAIRKDLKTEGP